MLVFLRLEVRDGRFLCDRTESRDGTANIQQRFTERCLPCADVRHERDILTGSTRTFSMACPPS